MGLAGRVDLGAEIGGGGAGFREVAGEDGLEERAEDDLGATVSCELRSCIEHFGGLRSLGKSHPEDQDKLEGVVEGCPRQIVVRYSIGQYLRNQ